MVEVRLENVLKRGVAVMRVAGFNPGISSIGRSTISIPRFGGRDGSLFVLVVMAFQRQIVSGLTAGAVNP